jgi:hypothetical protein
MNKSPRIQPSFLSVGSKTDILNQFDEGMIVSLNAEGVLTACIGMPNITQAEIASFSRGWRIYFNQFEDHFSLIFRFDSFEIESTTNIALVHQPEVREGLISRLIPPMKPVERFAIQLVVIDTSTQRIEKLGVFTISPQMSRLLNETIHAQLANSPSLAEYAKSINDMNRKFSLKELKRRAICTCKAGA